MDFSRSAKHNPEYDYAFLPVIIFKLEPIALEEWSLGIGVGKHGKVKFYVINIEGVPFRVTPEKFLSQNIHTANSFKTVMTLLGNENIRKLQSLKTSKSTQITARLSFSSRVMGRKGIYAT